MNSVCRPIYLIVIVFFVFLTGCADLQRSNPLDTTTTTTSTTTTTTTSTTTTTIAAPSAPTGFAVLPNYTNNTIELSWNANSESNISGYNIYRDTTGYSGYQKMNTSLNVTTTYVDTLVTAYHTYYYKITAVNSSGQESSYSTIDSGFTY